MLLVRLSVNSRLRVKFGRSQKLYVDFQLCRESVSLTAVLFKGQLYLDFKCWLARRCREKEDDLDVWESSVGGLCLSDEDYEAPKELWWLRTAGRHCCSGI